MSSQKKHMRTVVAVPNGQRRVKGDGAPSNISPQELKSLLQRTFSITSASNIDKAKLHDSYFNFINQSRLALSNLAKMTIMFDYSKHDKYIEVYNQMLRSFNITEGVVNGIRLRNIDINDVTSQDTKVLFDKYLHLVRTCKLVQIAGTLQAHASKMCLMFPAITDPSIAKTTSSLNGFQPMLPFLAYTIGELEIKEKNYALIVGYWTAFVGAVQKLTDIAFDPLVSPNDFLSAFTYLKKALTHRGSDLGKCKGIIEHMTRFVGTFKERFTHYYQRSIIESKQSIIGYYMDDVIEIVKKDITDVDELVKEAMLLTSHLKNLGGEIAQPGAAATEEYNAVVGAADSLFADGIVESSALALFKDVCK